MSRRLITAFAAGIGLLLVGGLTACATPTGPGQGPGSAAPAPIEDQDIDAAWLDDGRMIAIVTWGSSSCVPTATEVAFADGVLRVELEEPTDQPCTRDYVPRATGVGVPEGVDPARELEIVVTGAVSGDTDLDGATGLDPADAASEFLPSASWIGDDMLVYVTWGSSGCPPVVEDVATAGNVVTVTMAEPPADQVCTMDMAPRVSVLNVEGVDDDVATELVLTGAEFDDLRIPVLADR